MRGAALALVLATASLSGIAAPAAAQAVSPGAEDQRFTAFLDAEFEQELAQRPQLATRLGRKEGLDRWDDPSEAGQRKRLEWRRASVARMKAQFDRGKLSPELQASYDMWALELDRAELGYRFRRYTPPFYSYLYPAHSELPDFLINTHNVETAADMAAYVARLKGMPAVLDASIARSRQASAEGIRAPRFQYERVLSGSRTLTTGQPFTDGPDSPLWADAQAKVGRLKSAGKIDEGQAKALLDEARGAILALKPAYQRVIAWAEGDLPKARSGRVGAVSLPGGPAYYAAALKLNTTTDLTADQIHEIGLKEVARIRGEMDALARASGFKDTDAFYADRARRYPPVPWTDELRAERLKLANDSVAATRAKVPQWFGLTPQNRIEVIREPSFSEVAGGAAHAASPSKDGARPGRVWLHLQGVTTDPAEIPGLMCHEAVPGHVMQGDIQVRQAAGPKFRSAYRYVAFGEGWGLYSEALCKEMGVYPDAAADMMRLYYELWRAGRLVVDTGLHDKGWTEDQAVVYMRDVARLPEQQARSEVQRYITNAGQATGYKIGMLKILELRARAQRELGDRFDIKGFHDLLLLAGSVPLPVLERQVDGWIAARKG